MTTITASPDSNSPAYNPIRFQLDSTNKSLSGFRYIVDVVNVTTGEVIGTYKLKPEPVTLLGDLDISKLLQSQLYENMKPTAISYIADGHFISYRIVTKEEYFDAVSFYNYGFAGSGWANFNNPAINPNGFTRTLLIHSTMPTYTIGETINISQNSGAGYRAELEGIHTVLDVYLQAGVYYTVLDLVWIGGNTTSLGVVSFADGKKSIFSGVTSDVKFVYKGAIPFIDMTVYNGNSFRLIDDQGKFLTTLPENVRVSRNVQTYLSAYTPLGQGLFVVFEIGAQKYRYNLTSTNGKISLFQALPTTGNVTQQWNGATWGATTTPVNLNNIENYVISIKTGADEDMSADMTIRLYNECDYFDKFDICFLDRLGSWITIPFYKGAYENQDVQRFEYRTKFGKVANGNFEYQTEDSGKKIFHIEEMISHTVSTGQLSEVESKYMKELVSTPKAFISINGSSLQAINITNNSLNLPYKRTQRDRKVSVSFTMAVQDTING